MKLTYLIERWRRGDQWVPVGLWYILEGKGLAFYFPPEYDRMVEDFDTMGGYAQQLETHFANKPEVKRDAGLLEYYAAQTDADRDRTGPIEASVGTDFDPAHFFTSLIGG